MSLLDSVMRAASDTWPWYAVALFALGFAAGRKSLALVTVVLLVVTAVGFSDLACLYVLRPLAAQVAGAATSGELGLPSIHAANGMAAASVIVRLTRGWQALLAIVAAMVIGTSRVYLGVHAPADVLLAYVVGGVIGSIVIALYLVVSRVGQPTAT